MRKKDELSRSNTCMAHAHPDEMVFVLLGRDAAAPEAICAWAAERVRLGKNSETDDQIVEALACATTMQREGRKWADQSPDEGSEAAVLRSRMEKSEADLRAIRDRAKRARGAERCCWCGIFLLNQTHYGAGDGSGCGDQGFYACGFCHKAHRP